MYAFLCFLAITALAGRALLESVFSSSALIGEVVGCELLPEVIRPPLVASTCLTVVRLVPLGRVMSRAPPRNCPPGAQSVRAAPQAIRNSSTRAPGYRAAEVVLSEQEEERWFKTT